MRNRGELIPVENSTPAAHYAPGTAAPGEGSPRLPFFATPGHSFEKRKRLGYHVSMITVLREGGFRFVIYTDDHEPAHVHVYGDGEARINILRLEPISLRGMRRRDLEKAIAIVAANRERFLERWEEIHG
jgi:hypothetical protein